MLELKCKYMKQLSTEPRQACCNRCKRCRLLFSYEIAFGKDSYGNDAVNTYELCGSCLEEVSEQLVRLERKECL